MKRQQAEKLLAALIFDDLDEASKSELLAYLQTDDELREHLADMRMAVKVASDTVQHGPQPVLGRKHMKKLTKLARQQNKGPVIFTVNRMAVAAAAFLIVAVSAIVIFNQVGQTRTRYALAELSTPVVSSSSETSDFSDMPTTASGSGERLSPPDLYYKAEPAGTTHSNKYPIESNGRNVLFVDGHDDFEKYPPVTGDDNIWAYWNGGTIRPGSGNASGIVNGVAPEVPGGTALSLNAGDYFFNGDAAEATGAEELVASGDLLTSYGSDPAQSFGDRSEQDEAALTGRTLLGYHGADAGQLYVNMSDQEKAAFKNNMRTRMGAGSAPVDAAGVDDATDLYARGTGSGTPGGYGGYGYAGTGGGGYGGGMMGGMGGMGMMGGMGGRGGYGGGVYSNNGTAGTGAYGGGGYGGYGMGGAGGMGGGGAFSLSGDMYARQGQVSAIQPETSDDFTQSGVTWSTSGRVAADADGDGITDSMYVGKPFVMTGPAAVPPSVTQPVTGQAKPAQMPAIEPSITFEEGQIASEDSRSEEALVDMLAQVPRDESRPVAMDVDFGTKTDTVWHKKTEPALPGDGEMVDFDANGRKPGGSVVSGGTAVVAPKDTVAYDPAGNRPAPRSYSASGYIITDGELDFDWERKGASEDTVARDPDGIYEDVVEYGWKGTVTPERGGQTPGFVAGDRRSDVSKKAADAPADSPRRTTGYTVTGPVAAPDKPKSELAEGITATRKSATPAEGPLSLEEAERVPTEFYNPTQVGRFRGNRKVPAKPAAKQEGKAKPDSSGPAGGPASGERGQKVPILGDMPMIGGAFRGVQDTQAKSTEEGKKAQDQILELMKQGGKDSTGGLLERAKAYMQDGRRSAEVEHLNKLRASDSKDADATKLRALADMIQSRDAPDLYVQNGEASPYRLHADEITYPENLAEIVARPKPDVVAELDSLGVAEESADETSGPERESEISKSLTVAGPTDAGPVGKEEAGASTSSRPVDAEYEIIELKHIDAEEAKQAIEDSFQNLPGTDVPSGVKIVTLPKRHQVVISGRDDLRETAKKMVSEIDVPRGEVATEQTGESAESEFAGEDEPDLPPSSRFKAVPVNPWVMTERDSLSTFALDVDTASYALCRRYIRAGFKPPKGAVRMEEFINYFNYHYPQRAGRTFAVHAEAAPSPFASAGENLTLLKIGVKARTIGRDQRRAAHLVFVVDASASMGQADRLPLVQHALNLLVGKLSETDSISLITCSNDARMHLETTPAGDRAKISEAISAIQPSGSTNLLAGLKLGYAVARRSFSPKQVNHVVLCSDGVANVGQTEAEALLKEVDADRKQGITITCVGVGYGSYNDILMESLANRGDGSYVFLDSARQARRVFVEQLAATLHTVAKDARIQVDFNPQRVRRYRLIGYENRDIEDKRFRDDTIDAGEVGSGQCSTALYELELIGGPSAAHKELGTVYVRYRDVETGMIDEISRSIESELVRRHTVESAPRFFLAAGAARFAELLRESDHVRQTNYSEVLNIVEQVSIALPLDGDARELVNLVRKAEHLPKAP